MTLPALPADAVLGGVVLSVHPSSWRMLPEVRKHIRDTAAGGRRQQFPIPPAGGPVQSSRRTVSLSWQSLGVLKGAVEALLAGPGPFELLLWRREYLQFRGNGVLAEWNLPWALAVDSQSPPGGLAPALFELVITDSVGADVPVTAQVTATYDAGTPGAGTAWREVGGRRFKVAAALAAGDTLRVVVVPAYQVLEGTRTETDHRNPIQEPRDLVLLEV